MIEKVFQIWMNPIKSMIFQLYVQMMVKKMIKVKKLFSSALASVFTTFCNRTLTKNITRVTSKNLSIARSTTSFVNILIWIKIIFLNRLMHEFIVKKIIDQSGFSTIMPTKCVLNMYKIFRCNVQLSKFFSRDKYS